MAFYSTLGSSKPCEIAPKMEKMLNNENGIFREERLSFKHSCIKDLTII